MQWTRLAKKPAVVIGGVAAAAVAVAEGVLLVAGPGGPVFVLGLGLIAIFLGVTSPSASRLFRIVRARLAKRNEKRKHDEHLIR